MSSLATALRHHAALADKYAAAATRVEKVGEIEHVVFSYRERADAVRTGVGISPRYRDELSHFVERYPRVPDSLRNQAAPHANRLAATMARAVVQLKRHQSHGALDSSKLARLASPGLSAREFESMATRAYRRRDNDMRQEKPRVAIAGDFAYSLRHSNPAYVPMLQRLILIITEACNISGLQCAAYGTRGHIITAYGTSETKSRTAVIKDFDDELNGATYGLIATEAPFSAAYCSCTDGAGSLTGNGGVDFARAQGANFVIAIGNFPNDGARANCVVPPNSTVQQAVDIIAAVLEELQ